MTVLYNVRINIQSYEEIERTYMKKVILRIIALVILMIALAIGILLSQGYALPGQSEQLHYEKDWYLQIDEGQKEKVTLPFSYTYGGEVYRLSTRLSYSPDSTAAPYAFIDNHHAYFKVYVDGREIYHYTAEDTPSVSKSPGNAYSMIPLPRDCSGKELVVEFYPTLKVNVEYWMEDIVFADYASFMRLQFFDWLPQNIIMILYFFIGALMITSSLAIIKDKESRRLWYIGLFAILFGIYSASENRFNLYMIANPYLMYLANFIVFAAFPLPLLMFFRESVSKTYKKFYSVIVGAGVLNLVIQMILHFGGILDLREMLPATHICDLGGIIVIFYTFMKTPEDTAKRKRRTLLSIVPIAAGMGMDLVTHYTHVIEAASNTLYTQVGILLFLAMGAGSMIKTVLNSYKENLKNRYYKTMAYQDGLTGLYNRAAFQEEQMRIDGCREKYPNVICVCVDINNLKQINDDNGHLIGDQVICRVSTYLSDTFSTHGKVFRIGGDEFVVFVYDLDIPKLVQLLHAMGERVKTDNQTKTPPAIFAVGYDRLRPDEKMEVCVKRADDRMYELKKKQKNKSR